MGNLLLIFVLIVFTLCNQIGPYYYGSILYGLIILGGIFSVEVGKKIHWSVGLALSWSIFSALFFGFNFPSFYKNFSADNLNYLNNIISSGLSYLLIITGSVFLCSEQVFKFLVKSIPYLSITSVVLTLLKIPFPDPSFNPYGLMMNSSMDPSFYGASFPLTLLMLKSLKNKNENAFIILLALGHLSAILLSRGSVGLGAFAISVFAVSFLSIKKLKAGLGLSFSSLIILLVLGLFFFGNDLFSDSYRFNAYRFSFNWFNENANPWVGTGLSSYFFFGPLAQYLDSNGLIKEAGYFTFLHSDLLQIYFELGLIGIFLFALSTYFLIKNCLSFRKYHLLSSALSYLGVMVFNMPMRFFVTAFFGAVLIRLCFRRENEEDFIRP